MKYNKQTKEKARQLVLAVYMASPVDTFLPSSIVSIRVCSMYVHRIFTVLVARGRRSVLVALSHVYFRFRG